jgi:enoyl-CoA hydratase/carnithine racemase
MAYENIQVETLKGGVAVVTLNRPRVLNALSFDLKRELSEALVTLDADPDIRALVITGSGPKAFSAGADIHEMARFTPESSKLWQEQSVRFHWHLASLRVPTIGAMNGLAFGGGALVASCLDIRIGCERSKFRFLAAQYGRLNSTWSLPVIVGWARAKELLYTGRVVETEEAARIGLLNKVVPSEQLLDAAVDMARQIAKNVPGSVQQTKRLLNEDIGRSLREMYDAELDAVTNRLTMSPVSVGFAEFLARKGQK